MAFEHLSDLAQHGIAGIVSVSVVEHFEMIHVQHDEAQGMAVARGARKLTLSGKLQMAPVVQIRQRIALRTAAQGFLQPQITERQ